MKLKIYPFRRFFARQLDSSIGVLTYAFLSFLFAVFTQYSNYNDPYERWASIFRHSQDYFQFFKSYNYKWNIYLSLIFLLIEPFLISLFGFTPGKYFLGLRVLKKNGNKLTYKEALKRSALCALIANALWLDYVSWIANCYAYYKLSKSGELKYDKDLDCACLKKSDFPLV